MSAQIQEVGTAKGDLKAYLEDAANDLKVNLGSQKAHKLAVYRYIADILRIEGGQRQDAWKHFAKTSSAFGCNASALAQELGVRKPDALKTLMAEIEA